MLEEAEDLKAKALADANTALLDAEEVLEKKHELASIDSKLLFQEHMKEVKTKSARQAVLMLIASFILCLVLWGIMYPSIKIRN